MNYFNILKSRTNWTIIILFAINGINGIKEYVPPNVLFWIDGVLSLAAIYFRVNPKADYSKK